MDHLLHINSESQKNIFLGLSIFENTDFETSSGGMEDGNGIVGLGSICN